MSRSMEGVLLRLAFRQLLTRRRLVAAGALVALPTLVALAMGEPAPGQEATRIVELHSALLVAVILPLAAVVFGTAVFGSELEDGTITFILGKPVARWRIALTRIAAAALLTGLVTVPASLLAGLAVAGGLDSGGLVLGFTAALAVGGVVYAALFVALSLAIRRALLAGLAYVLLWEGVLSDLFVGTRLLSVRQYTTTLAEALAPGSPGGLGAGLETGTALMMAALVTLAASAFAVHRLRWMEITRAA